VPSEPCPVPASSTPSPIGAESFDIVASISEYLNTGGTLDALEDKIGQLALLIQETPAIIESDFNGDGFIDLVVSILLPSLVKATFTFVKREGMNWSIQHLKAH
jgi:hypothetical protein